MVNDKKDPIYYKQRLEKLLKEVNENGIRQGLVQSNQDCNYYITFDDLQNDVITTKCCVRLNILYD